jgi:hypothetical protein
MVTMNGGSTKNSRPVKRKLVSSQTRGLQDFCRSTPAKIQRYVLQDKGDPLHKKQTYCTGIVMGFPLLDLPEQSLVRILYQWLSLKDIVNMDNGFCDRKARVRFLCVLKSLQFGRQQRFPVCAGSVRWISLRTISPRHIELDDTKLSLRNAGDIFCQGLGKKITSITCRAMRNSQLVLLQTALIFWFGWHSCRKLELLDCGQDSDQEVYLQVLELQNLAELVVVRCGHLRFPNRGLLERQPLCLQRLVVHFPADAVVVYELLRVAVLLEEVDLCLVRPPLDPTAEYHFRDIGSVRLRQVKLTNCSMEFGSAPSRWRCLEQLVLDCIHLSPGELRTILRRSPRLLKLSLCFHIHLGAGFGVEAEYLTVIGSYCNPGLQDLQLHNVSSVGDGLQKCAERFCGLRVLLLDIPLVYVNFADLAAMIARQSSILHLCLHGLNFTDASFLNCVGPSLESLDLAGSTGTLI